MGRFLHPKQNKTKQGKAQNEEEIKTDSGPDPPPSIYRLATQLGFSLPAAGHHHHLSPAPKPPGAAVVSLPPPLPSPALVPRHGNPLLADQHP